MDNKQIVLVSGAVNGIGRAIAERFLDEGYFVIAADLDEPGGMQMMDSVGKHRMEFVTVNVAEEKQVRQLFQHITSEYGKLDILINNAGIIRDNLIWNMPSDDFDDVILVNLRGPWLMCREASLLMKKQNSGRIVNVASRAWLGNKGQSNYSASKAGVIALTRVMALELGKYNVQVNAVAPGLIDSPLTRGLKKEVLQSLIEAQPTKTMGSAEDVANAVFFLSDPKTNFITGQTIYVDGGKSIGAGL